MKILALLILGSIQLNTWAADPPAKEVSGQYVIYKEWSLVDSGGYTHYYSVKVCEGAIKVPVFDFRAMPTPAVTPATIACTADWDGVKVHPNLMAWATMNSNRVWATESTSVFSFLTFALDEYNTFPDLQKPASHSAEVAGAGPTQFLLDLVDYNTQPKYRFIGHMKIDFK